MGTETKFNCYKENTTTTGGGIIPKAFNGSSAAASGIVVVGAGQKLHGSTATNGIILNGAIQHKQQQQEQQQPQLQQNGSTNGCSVVDCSGITTLSTTAKAQPHFVPIQIGEDVIEGAKDILKVIRPHWDLNVVQFKKFTDGITNKLVGCFHNPPIIQKETISNGNSNGNSTARNSHGIIIGNGSDNGNGIGIGIGNGNVSLLVTDDNNDSGNISDSDTVDEEIKADAATEITEIKTANRDSNVVLVRVYGNKTDLLIDRKAETRNILLLHSYGFAPTLYATFKNGLVYDYVPGVTLNTTNVLEPKVWRLVACRMAEMHRVVKVRDAMNGDGGDGGGGGGGIQPLPVPMLWQKTQNFFDLVPERFTDPEKHKRIEGTLLPIRRLRDEFTTLYRRLENLGSPVVFAHNDLLLGNIVYLESQQCVNFIDYEYAAYNFQAFDIGNHFCEFAGVDEVDYARYPTREFQLEWLRVYLQAYLQRAHVSDAEVERLYVQVNLFALAAHFFWIIWSLIQAEHSNIDFDYVDYALTRYKEYLERKAELLALDTNGHNAAAKEEQEKQEQLTVATTTTATATASCCN